MRSRDAVPEHVVDGSECPTQFGGSWRFVSFQQWAEQASLELGVEDGDSDPFGGEDRALPRHL